MEVFWDRGYAGTSLEDLIDGTGLSRGSIYKAFGDKQGLFLAALDAYISANVSAMRDCLADGSVAAIRAALLQAGRHLVLEPGRRGCLIVNSTCELAGRDELIYQRMRAALACVEALFADTLRVCQATGELGPDVEVEALSRFLVCTVQGVGVLGKTGQDERQLRQVVDTAMSVLK
jgi:TetR/AcrR family transcriptional regulator, transcriptional repressor for nem operon